MSLMMVGGLAGLLAAVGVLMLVRAVRSRRTNLVERIAPYLREKPRTSSLLQVTNAPAPGSSTVSQFLARWTVSAGRFLERIGSSSQSVRARLARAGAPDDEQRFRLEQLAWALMALVPVLVLGLCMASLGSVNVPALLLAGLVAMVSGAAARDWWLTQQVVRRRRRIEAQLPDVVELLALVVGAGQGPVDAIERIVALGQGDLIDELAVTLAEIRSGVVLTTALDHMDQRVDSPQVSRLTEAIAVALERGTPLAEVLRAQAADAREASRRALMEAGGRKEIAQMVPVVFLVLPVTVVFALFPGIFVLRLGL